MLKIRLSRSLLNLSLLLLTGVVLFHTQTPFRARVEECLQHGIEDTRHLCRALNRNLSYNKKPTLRIQQIDVKLRIGSRKKDTQIRSPRIHSGAALALQHHNSRLLIDAVHIS